MTVSGMTHWVPGTIQLLKGHRFDHGKSHRMAINNRVTRPMVLEMDPETTRRHPDRVYECQNTIRQHSEYPSKQQEMYNVQRSFTHEGSRCLQ